MVSDLPDLLFYDVVIVEEPFPRRRQGTLPARGGGERAHSAASKTAAFSFSRADKPGTAIGRMPVYGLGLRQNSVHAIQAALR